MYLGSTHSSTGNRYFGVTNGMRPRAVQSCFAIQSKAYPFNYLAVDFYRKPQGGFYLCFGFAVKHGHKKKAVRGEK